MCHHRLKSSCLKGSFFKGLSREPSQSGTGSLLVFLTLQIESSLGDGRLMVFYDSYQVKVQKRFILRTATHIKSVKGEGALMAWVEAPACQYGWRVGPKCQIWFMSSSERGATLMLWPSTPG